ncbi:bifunctional 5,10-methylenetetrahydrofolate dehydrogenase/5,10-methenyltetrahydrofolate cyclohydrolase [Longirhabdus pacifica]|uniref:bifunctional 5,10-methylenetetrahydrofolate dehydrogenase/5,10-methenyltetrahydrofolate cyclohydrolase n=1 Tax=Longirhabdus pacifica TaxID=2305227 RepID=UPI001009021B|nr:tetrahydrofolate dehydrogenase/cyclohydrolase catalytic domain-containing protein [Longirhabdus pacifica]
MTAKIIDGKAVRDEILCQLKNEMETLKQQGVTPGLAVVIVGDNPASKLYVGMKIKKCKELGMHSAVHEKSADITQEELVALIHQLNEDENIHGILVQLPLPAHIQEEAIISAIDAKKDVDGFHPYNVGNLMIGDAYFLPCTPAGIIALLKHYNMEIAGKHAVVVGRSNIVGKPVSLLLLEEHATVTMCHSKTSNLAEIVSQGDIVIAATGRPDLLGKEHIKPGAVVIDVGSPKSDVKFEEVKEVASYITPVPGGVGPMTIAMLMKNTVLAAKQRIENTTIQV